MHRNLPGLVHGIRPLLQCEVLIKHVFSLCHHRSLFLPHLWLCLKLVLHQRLGHLWDKKSNFFPLRKTENFINFTSKLFFLWRTCSDYRVLDLWAMRRNGSQMYNDTTSLSNLSQGYLHMLGFAETGKKKEKSWLMARLTLSCETIRLTLQSLKNLCGILKCAFQASEFLKMHFQKYHNFNKDPWLTLKNIFKQFLQNV